MFEAIEQNMDPPEYPEPILPERDSQEYAEAEEEAMKELVGTHQTQLLKLIRAHGDWKIKADLAEIFDAALMEKSQ